MVKTTTTTITEMPQWSGNASIRGLATNTQKTTTGTMMTDIVRKMDLTSGPNMNLPCKKNSCKQKKKWNSNTKISISSQFQKTAANRKRNSFVHNFLHF
jgi:hypothetical protein